MPAFNGGDVHDMKGRHASTLIVCCAILLTSATRPQLHPDFSGVWTFVQPPAAEARLNFLRTWIGDPVTITQTSVTLTIEYVSGDRAHAPVTLVYKLDGSEAKNVVQNSAPESSPERPTRAVWQGKSLVLTTTNPRVTNGESDPLVITEVLSLESSTTMSVAITRTSKSLTDHAVARYRRAGNRRGQGPSS
jgi:hypothetical protein